MPYQLLNLRNVPEDEATEVRALLDEHHIPYYQTPPGPWGISMGAIWIRDETHARRAKQLLDDYSHERQQRMRTEWETAKREGRADTFVDQLRRHPVRTLAFLALVGAILYVMLVPFLRLIL